MQQEVVMFIKRVCLGGLVAVEVKCAIPSFYIIIIIHLHPRCIYQSKYLKLSLRVSDIQPWNDITILTIFLAIWKLQILSECTSKHWPILCALPLFFDSSGYSCLSVVTIVTHSWGEGELIKGSGKSQRRYITQFCQYNYINKPGYYYYHKMYFCHQILNDRSLFLDFSLCFSLSWLCGQVSTPPPFKEAVSWATGSLIESHSASSGDPAHTVLQCYVCPQFYIRTREALIWC